MAYQIGNIIFGCVLEWVIVTPNSGMCFEMSTCEVRRLELLIQHIHSKCMPVLSLNKPPSHHLIAAVTLTVAMKHCKQWDYNGINHLSTGAGFLPSTVPLFGL